MIASLRSLFNICNILPGNFFTLPISYSWGDILTIDSSIQSVLKFFSSSFQSFFPIFAIFWKFFDFSFLNWSFLQSFLEFVIFPYPSDFTFLKSIENFHRTQHRRECPIPNATTFISNLLHTNMFIGRVIRKFIDSLTKISKR